MLKRLRRMFLLRVQQLCHEDGPSSYASHLPLLPRVSLPFANKS
jgi:hypothetical protein